MMNCQDVEMLLLEYVSGELDAATEARITNHLHQCPSCCQEMEREKMLANTLGSLPSAEKLATPAFAYTTPQPSQWWLPTSGGFIAAAILLAILVPGKPKLDPVPPTPSAQELAAATQDVKWTLALAGRIIEKNEQDTLIDIFGTKLPTAISSSLFPTREPENDNKS